MLVTGDLEDAAIPGLIDRYAGTGLLDVDVYIVGHHGSANGTTPAFVAAMSPDVALIGMGPPERQADYSAWKFGHPRRSILEMLESGVAGSREPIQVQAGTGSREFETFTVTRAVYATGWDGDVVLEAGADGAFRRLEAAGVP